MVEVRQTASNAANNPQHDAMMKCPVSQNSMYAMGVFIFHSPPPPNLNSARTVMNRNRKQRMAMMPMLWLANPDARFRIVQPPYTVLLFGITVLLCAWLVIVIK